MDRLKEEGEKIGIPAKEEPELVYSELFNMVRGWRTGRAFDRCLCAVPHRNYSVSGRR
ncbi:hypothetical protein [Syntrophaceticus schinkii]|uniref:hypothetical protein n=1 Tax=Syntrophaceticus schinkii TaxID=499207 RepID=UPI0012EC12FF|nr:hypothetical protein [Syntrophaceticus schinkii]